MLHLATTAHFTTAITLIATTRDSTLPRYPARAAEQTHTYREISVLLVRQGQPPQTTQSVATVEQVNIGLTEIVHLVQLILTAQQERFSVSNVRNIQFLNPDQEFVIVEQASSGRVGIVQYVQKTPTARRVLTSVYLVHLALLHLPVQECAIVLEESTG